MNQIKPITRGEFCKLLWDREINIIIAKKGCAKHKTKDVFDM